MTDQYKHVLMQQCQIYFVFEPLSITIHFHVTAFNKENTQCQEAKLG
jgi:hypothetical protein